MSADKNPKIKCPFCSWCRRTFHVSNHFLTQHIDKLCIRPFTNDHCLLAYAVHDKEEIDFCACLTCGKGTLGDGNSGNSSRWIELHSKNKACKVHHRKKLADLRESIRVATTVVAPPTEASTVTIAAPAPILHSVWASLKKNKPFVPFMEDVEVFCKMCKDDSDDDFDNSKI